MTMEPGTEEIPPERGLAAVILAAGLGKRMRSARPKVLHRIAGAPLISHVLRAVAPLAPTHTVVVVGHGADQVRATLGPTVTYATQTEQRGTGHALLQARAALEGQSAYVLALYGDTPLLRAETLQELVARHRARPGTRATILTACPPDPTGYGRVLRDAAGAVTGVVEERVATPEERALREVNSGIYCFDADWLWPHLAELPVHPGADEIFLTDMIDRAVADAPGSVQTLPVADFDEVAGINDRVQLAEADRTMRDRIRTAWMRSGVTMMDPATTYVDVDVTIGRDTILYPGCLLEGHTVVGPDCTIGPRAQLVDATVGAGCRVGASLLESCAVDDGVDIGSFNHLRPGTHLATGVHLGNFAEVKNSRLGEGVAMGHFSYVGDADVGAHTNIGAGTITVNFDRIRGKSRTTIGPDAFVGSGSLLIAPVEVGAGAATGAGAVVTKNVPAGALVVGMPARVIRWLSAAAGPAATDAAPAPASPEEKTEPA